jgi:anti-sigma-K factor RskA
MWAMTEHPEMSCAELAEVAAELALGVLTGRERAEAVAHLDHCESCREHVRQLMVTTEGLVGLLPEREPPAGFETRVLDRLGLSAPGLASTARGGVPLPRRPSLSRWTRAESFPRRTLAAAAVALAVVIAGLGGWGVGVSMSLNPVASQAQAPLSSAVFLTASHQSVGQLFIYQDSPRWLYMSVDLPSGDGMVTCQVIGSDGKVSVLGKFRLTSGYGAWGSPVPGNLGGVRGARLVAADGTALATASFG